MIKDPYLAITALFFVPWFLLAAIIEWRQRKFREYAFNYTITAGGSGFDTSEKTEKWRTKYTFWHAGIIPFREGLCICWLLLAALWYYMI